MEPTFSEDCAFQHFKSTYETKSRIDSEFSRPEWLPSVTEPSIPLCIPRFSLVKVRDKINKSRSDSSPSPLDQIGYRVLKRCPSLVTALVHLYNLCLDSGTVPKMWKLAVIKLISKPGKSTTKDPSTFRPIALTSVIGKIFTSILKDVLFNHLINNNYLSKSIQKGFVSHVNGCQEHQFKLIEAIRDARLHQRSQTVIWLDLQNAFGSVEHKLIQFALSHYHCGTTMSALISNLYHGLGAIVSTSDWSTPVFHYGKGVFQGDPLSVAIFDMVINLHVDALTPLQDQCVYRFSKTENDMMLSIFADDICIVTSGVKEANLLCERTNQFLKWSQLDVNISKCACFSRSKQAGSACFDPHVNIGDKKIPFLSKDSSYRYLGLPVTSDLRTEEIKSELLSTMTKLIDCVDKTAVSKYSKCLLYKRAILPRLSWLLSIADLPMTWIELKLDGLANRYLKKWVGLAHSAAVSRLYLEDKHGGLDLPQPSVSYKKCQATKLLQFTKSSDICLKSLAQLKVEQQMKITNRRFTPGACLTECTLPDAPLEKQKKAVRKHIQSGHQQQHLDHLSSLPKQGATIRCKDIDSLRWSSVIQSLPDEQFKWAMNAVQDTLPTRLNLQIWKKSRTSQCSLCGQTQSLCHVLNACSAQLRSGMYKDRHDKVLVQFRDFLKEHLPADYRMIADVPESEYIFPFDIAITSLRPDIVVWSRRSKKAWLLELSVVFETNVEETRERKEDRYQDLVKESSKKYETKLCHHLVGSRGLIFDETVRSICQICRPLKDSLDSLLKNIIKIVIKSSYCCWLSRNKSSVDV